MSVDLILDQPIGSANAIRLGLFDKVRIGHRRIAADSLKVIRKFDGAWHFGGAAYLEARLETSSGSGAKIVKVQVSRPWAARSPGAVAASVRLYGSRLLGDGECLVERR